MEGKTKVVLHSLKALGAATTEELYKYIVRTYGKGIPSLQTILDVLVELGFIQYYTVNGKTIYVYPREGEGQIPTTTSPTTTTEVKIEEEKEVKQTEFTDQRLPKSKKKVDRIIPVNRDYDWDKYIPKDNVPEYIPQGNELKKLEVCQRLRIEGPPGCGKTLMVEWYCYKNKLPFFSIQGFGARAADLIGTPWIVGDTAYWVDGKLTKALLCSQERPCVLLVDEFNRMDPHEQALFLEVADYRCQITIPTTSETIKGNPDNLKIVLTMNVGTEYFVHRLDDAVRRRFPRIELDFLGLVKPELEIQAIVKQTGISKDLAKLMVNVANKIRMAAKTEKSTIKKGIPTHNVIEWARLAVGYSKCGISNPLIEAGFDAIASYYDGLARKEVEQIIVTYCDVGKQSQKKNR